MKVSILGCGWFGFALANVLTGKGIQVNGSTTSADKLQTFAAAGITPFLIDLNKGLIQTDFFIADVLIIAIPPKSRSGEGAAYVPKLQRVIEALKNCTVTKVILISSTGVYADLNRDVDELTDPQSASASSKILWEAEELFRNQSGIKTTIIRFGGLIGPGREPGRFFAGKTDIPNGLAPVNMIHLDDCIAFTEAVIDKDAFGYTFNACTPHHPLKNIFYTQAAQQAGLPLPQFLPELNEWKTVNSVTTGPVLNYTYHINNWDTWLA